MRTAIHSFAAGLVLIPAVVLAQITQPLVKELRDSVQRERERFLAVVEQSDVAYDMTIRGVSESGKATGPTRLRRVVSSSPSAGGTRVVSTDVASGGSSTASVNPKYAFTVTQNSAGAAPYIAGYRPSDPPKMANDHYVRAGFGAMHNTVIELMDGPYVRSQTADEQIVDGHRYVVARFTRTFKDYDTPLPVWMVFDPQQDWRVVQFAEHFSWGVMNVRIRYQRGPNGILFPAEVGEFEHAYYGDKWTETAVLLELPVPCALQAKDFTLQAYGLDVPSEGSATASAATPSATAVRADGGVDSPPAPAGQATATDGRRLYLVGFIAAAGVALIAAATVFRKKQPSR